MSTCGTTDHRGLFHEAAFYGSDDDFLATMVPFLQGGVEAGQPTAAVVGEGNAELLRAALGETSNISFMDARAHYTRPASVIKAYRDLLAKCVAGGAQQIRVVGEVPHPGTGLPGEWWEWWARYEAAFNHAFAEFPVWVICPYDSRTAPAEVLADVARAHPHVATADGRHLASAGFEDPARFLLTRGADAGADPMETTPPLIELVDPTPSSARWAVRDAGRASRLVPVEVDKFVFAVNEAVTNAVCHGRPPVRLRLWSGPDRMVATVTDRGHGPSDPFAGLLPANDTSVDGAGLWLTHQICSHVTLGRDNDGYIIRLVAGTPDLAA